MQRGRSILLLCLVTLISSVTCQDAAEPSALEPAAVAELLPEHVSASEAAALLPLSEAAKAQLVESMMVGVQAGKDEVKQALADPNAAFEQYSAKWATGDVGVASVPAPGGATDTKTLAQRKRIFLANLKRYNRLNAEDPHVAHGITPFTHLTVAEFKAIMLPLDMTPKDTAPATTGSSGRRLKACGDPVSNPYTSGTPPASVNWLTANMLTPIRDQGTICGSCAAFATTGVAEFAYIKKNNIALAKRALVDLSEQELLDYAAGDQCQGAYPDQYIRQIGCAGGMVNEATDPYRATDTMGPAACPNPVRFPVGISAWAYVPNTANGLARAVVKAPTLITVDASDWSSYTGGYFGTNCPSYSSINHAVVAVGYVNGVTVGTKKYDFWLVRNSWSKWWGNKNADPYKGYVWVRKDCTNTGGAYSIYKYSSIVPIVG